jgi:cytochrome c
MPGPSRALLCLLGVGALASAVVLGADALQRRRQAWDQAAALTLGDPALGQGKIAALGCGGCHEIPGVDGANGRVGPSLKGIAGRAYVAGRLNNTPDNLEAWIAHPRRIDPQTAMPELGVDPRDARDIAAYLYTLR